MFRSVISVISGLAAWTVLWLSGNAALAAAMPEQFRADGTSDSLGILAMILALSLICSLIGGYTTAMFAKRDPMKHVWALAVLQLIIGILVQIQYLDVIPMAYHLAFLSLLIPGILAGGRLQVTRVARIGLVGEASTLDQS